jgi:hypothetical protein
MNEQRPILIASRIEQELWGLRRHGVSFPKDSDMIWRLVELTEELCLELARGMECEWRAQQESGWWQQLHARG